MVHVKKYSRGITPFHWSNARYSYEFHYLKPTEGGMDTSTFKNLNRYSKRKDVVFEIGSSPYVAHWSAMIWAKNSAAFKYGLKLAQNFGYFDGVTLSDAKKYG